MDERAVGIFTDGRLNHRDGPGLIGFRISRSDTANTIINKLIKTV